MMTDLMKCPLLIILGLATFVAGPAGAQECKVEDSLAECWEKYLTSRGEPLKKEQGAKTANDVRRIETGADTGGEATASNAKDFLTLLKLTGLLSMTDEGGADATSGTMALDLNFLLPTGIKEKSGQLQAVINTDPKPYDPIVMKIPEADREDGVKAFEEGFSNLDDVTVTFSYNVVSEKLGRSFKAHRSLYATLFEAAQARLSEETAPMALLDFAVTELGVGDRTSDVPCGAGGQDEDTGDFSDESAWENLVAGGAESCSFLELAREKIDVQGSDQEIGELEKRLGMPNLTESERANLESQIKALQTKIETLTHREAERILTRWESAVREEAQVEKLILRSVEKAGISKFKTLLNNQPQFFVSLSKKFRENFVGPDELSGKITYERPYGPSLSDFLSKHSAKCDEESEKLQCLDAFHGYVTKHKGQMENSDRFSFSLEYAKIDDLMVTFPESVMVPDEDRELSFEGSDKLIVAAGWGRQIEVDDAGNPTSRLDVKATYEDVSNDPMRRSRGLLTLTWTRNFQGMSLPFSIIYSNRSEFIDMQDVDERLSAHVGVKFTLPGKVKPK